MGGGASLIIKKEFGGGVVGEELIFSTAFLNQGSGTNVINRPWTLFMKPHFPLNLIFQPKTSINLASLVFSRETELWSQTLIVCKLSLFSV